MFEHDESVRDDLSCLVRLLNILLLHEFHLLTTLLIEKGKNALKQPLLSSLGLDINRESIDHSNKKKYHITSFLY